MSNLFESYAGRGENVRHEQDLYPTPAIATYTLLREEHSKYECPPYHLFDPCAGRGHISIILKSFGNIVDSSDLYDYENSYMDNIMTGPEQDVFEMKFSSECGIVTNPPFKNGFPLKLAKKILLEDGCEYLAMFSRNTFMESMSRYEFFKKNAPSRIYLFADRLNCADHELFDTESYFGGLTNYAWYVWDYRDGVTRNTFMHFVSAKSYMNEFKESYNLSCQE